MYIIRQKIDRRPILLYIKNGYGGKTKGECLMFDYKPVPYHPIVQIDKLYTVHYFHFEADHKRIDEQHDFWELVYMDRNEAYICTDDKKVLLHQGEMILHAPNVSHGIEGAGHTASNIGIISFSSPSDVLYRFDYQRLVPDAAQRKLLRRILQEGYSTFGVQLDMSHSRGFSVLDTAPIGSVQMILLYLQQMLILMLRNPVSDSGMQSIPGKNEEKSLYENELAGLVSYMNQHLRDNLSFNQLAKHSGMGATTLKKEFYKKYEIGVIAYYQQLRLEETRRMLREGTCNISQVAENFGFSSGNYFSSWFKKSMGMTPTEYTNSIHPQTQ